MQDWPVLVIPNTLDILRFQPWPRFLARKVLGLPQEIPIVLFGAIGGGRDPRKGFDLLQQALTELATLIPDVAAVIFGQSEPLNPPQLGLPLYWMGHMYDEISLSMLYSAADVTVVPSRQENLPQSGTEAQSCGCPVVAFNCTGLTDVVVHQQTGYLANPFDSHDLANGIAWVLNDPDRYARLSTQSRDRAVRLWSPEVVVKQYLGLYEHVLARNNEEIS